MPTSKPVGQGRLADQAQRQFDRLRASYPERTHRHPPEHEIFPGAFPVRRTSL